MEASDKFAALRDVENDPSETARVTNSAEIAVLMVVSAATRDVDAVASAFPMAVREDARTLISEDNVVESVPFLVFVAVVALASDVCTETMDALKTPTSAVNAAPTLVSAVVSETTAELSADETAVIALTRLTTSVESALYVVVMSAITLAICVKLGLVFNTDAISANVSRLLSAFPFRPDIAVLNALVVVDISLTSEVESPAATVEMDGSATLSTAETEPTWLTRADTSVERAELNAVLALLREPNAMPDATEIDAVWLLRAEISDEIVPIRLALVESINDPAKLVETDNADTDELSAVDSATNAADMPKLVVCCCDVAPEAETESEVTADPRVLTSTLRAVLNAASLAVNADAAALTVLDTSDND